MSWLRIDDKFPRHPKVAALTDREFRVHVRLLCWCSEYGTEGNVPAGAFSEVAGLTATVARRFIELGLWDETDDGHPVIHDFQEYRPKDATNADRQRAWRERNAPRNGRVTEPVTEEPEKPNGEDNASLTRAPGPVPVPEVQEESASTLSSQIREIYDHWRQARGKTRANYDRMHPSRAAIIRARLRDGYSVEDCKRAIDAVALDDWPGRNEGRNDDVEYILGPKRIDGWLDRAAGVNGHDPEAAREQRDRLHAERVEAMQRAKGWIE